MNYKLTAFLITLLLFSSFAVALPDLAVVSVQTSPQNPTDKDGISYNVTVQNIGRSKASVSTLSFSVSSWTFFASTPALSPGKSSSSVFKTPANGFGGTQIMRTKADYYTKVKESNETNNELTKPITITPATGSIFANSDPMRASITIDGIALQFSTPATYPGLDPGFHVVALNLTGYQDYSETVQVTAGSTTTVYAVLSPILPTTGDLSVSSEPAGAALYLDSVYKGTTPVLVTGIAPGGHTVNVSKTGYVDYVQTINIVAGGVAYLSPVLSPVPTTGDLASDSIPQGASLYVDNVYRGLTPVNTTGLSPGAHALKFSLSGYMNSFKNITIIAGSTTFVTQALAAAVTGTPDLVVSDISWVPSSPTNNDTVTLQFTVSNIGTASAGTSTLVAGGWGALVNDLIPQMAPGGSYTTTHVTPAPYPGITRITATADYYGNVLESNENNNALQKNLTVVWAGKTLTVSVSVTGNSAYVTSTPSGADVSLDGSQFAGVTPTTISNVPGGQHYVVVSIPGYTTVTSNFTVGTVSSQTISSPDLVITDFSFSKPNPSTADYETITVTVKNIGTATAAGDAYVGLKGNLKKWRIGGISNLAPGATGSVSVSTWLNQGGYYFNAEVDDFQRVNESNESNNMMIKQITVGTGNTGSMSIDSNLGASVYLDYAYVGKAPLTLTEVSSGKHLVHIQKQGYMDSMTAETAYSGMTTTVNRPLSSLASGSPDMTVKDIVFIPFVAGVPMTWRDYSALPAVWTIIQNVGGSTATTPVTAVNGAGTSTRTGVGIVEANHPSDSLLPGEAFALSFSPVASDGTYTINSTTDPDNWIAELDETNNAMIKDVAITSAPPSQPTATNTTISGAAVKKHSTNSTRKITARAVTNTTQKVFNPNKCYKVCSKSASTSCYHICRNN